VDTPLIEEHHAAGAQLAEFQGCVLPDKFFEFDREYQAAKNAAAVIDTNWCAILVLTGRDRVQYLHNISSADIKGLAEGRGTFALLLNPQGHILAELEVYSLPEKLLVLSHAAFRERTVATLKKYVIGSQVRIEDETERLASVAVEGPRATEVIAEVCGVEISDLADMSIKEASFDGVSGFLLKRSHFGGPGAEIIVPRESIVEVWRKLVASARTRGGEPIGMAALNTLRLEVGVPWFPVDFGEAQIPHEAAVETTHVSFNKGCYTGQEIVERVRSRGHVNRKRVLLKFSTSAPPAAGTKLYAGGSEIGYVTSAAFSPAAGTAIGVGYVRREQFAAGSVVEFEGGTATVA